MIEQVVRLIYPPNLLNMPIINQLIRRYDQLGVNIMRAEVSPNEGWIEIQLVGNPAMIESAISWLQEQGIEVQTLGA
ncbi:NIL domain-containing protein [Chloroflexota bacterium]